ncbi:hypothetical protein [Niallia circulans]|uniref:Uncharacterized protein n=1 Tax=Niallia circulans TaxID=1397 RepID=A0A941G9E1_NIACI|nr:hypothetical protein [Niallia circulans]MCB5235895.1 hypothetical protein [Niallia circulans]
MDEIKTKLQYILNTVQDATLPSNKPIILVTVTELIEEVRNSSFSYKATYYTGKNKAHFYRYICLAKKSKAKLLTDLEEIEYEIRKMNMNEKRISVLLSKMLNTELYTADLQNYIDRWINTTNSQNKKYTLLVK